MNLTAGLPRALAIGLAVALTATLGLLAFVETSRGEGAVTYTVDSLEDDPLAAGCEPTEGCTLREALYAIEEEEEEGATYKIVFTVEGTIELEGELFLHPGAEDVAVEIEGPGASKLILDAGGNGRVFSAREVDLEMSGVTMTGGQESDLIDGGGGFATFESEVTLAEVRVTGNEISGGSEGGGIAVENGAGLVLKDSLVDHNVSAEEMGGGIFVEGGSRLTVKNSTIEANEAAENAGGGIAMGAVLFELRNSTVKGNKSAEGGGGLWIGVQEPGIGAVIVDSRIEGNHSDTYGGGLKAEGWVSVEGSTFAGNTAGGIGGGMYVEERTEVATSTFTENEGGAITGASEQLSIRNSTVVGNTAAAGAKAAGVYGTDVSVVSSILYGNSRNGEASDCEGTITSEGFNLLGSELGCGWSGASGDRVGEDPLLAPLGDYGGPTATMPPESRLSPVINHGGDPQLTDQRGFTRPVPAGAPNTDIGAVEVQAPSPQTEVTVSPSENLEVDDTLSCDRGSWDVDTVTDPSFEYSWFAEHDSEREAVGSGETLVLDAALAGRRIVCEVTADNGAVAVAAASDWVELDPAHAEASPTSIDFEARPAGTSSAPQTILLTASGGVPLEVTDVKVDHPQVFEVDASDCTAQPLSHSSCEIEVVFSPETHGVVADELRVETSGNDPVVGLAGIGIEPVFAASPAALEFAQTEVGSEAQAQKVLVVNDGNGSLAIEQVDVEGGAASDFRIDDDGCTGAELGEAESCAVKVAFVPTAPGLRQAQLVFAGEDGGSVALSGTAVAPGLAATPAALEFGSQPLGAGATAPRSLVVSNPGTAPTRIDSIAIEGTDAGDFSFVGNECLSGTLQPGGECLLNLVFDPTEAGPRSAQLVVRGELSITVPLAGSGAAPEPPAPRLRFQRGKGPLAVGADGAAHPRFACVSSQGACRARVSLLRTGAAPGVPARLGSKQLTLAAGRARATTIPLTKAARRALATRGRLPVILTVNSAGPPTRIHVTLRATPSRPR